jgi:hypothetical protein
VPHTFISIYLGNSWLAFYSTLADVVVAAVIVPIAVILILLLLLVAALCWGYSAWRESRYSAYDDLTCT